MPRDQKKRYYFDYNATSPLDALIAEEMVGIMSEVHGNPSSVHQIGQEARFLLDDCRYRISQLWQCKPSEIIFTSGGTESNNLALFGSARLRQTEGKHIITSSIEHHAVLHTLEYLEKYEGYEITRLAVNSSGHISCDELKNAIREDTILVSIMAANNEMGAIQSVSEIGAICQEANILYHTDAVQWFGKIGVNSIHDFKADLVSICGHKFHGPKGSGILFVKSPLLPHPILFGGGHENERRAGTENLPAIIGLTRALERFTKDPIFKLSHFQAWKTALKACVDNIDGVHVRSSCEDSLDNTFAFTVDKSDGMTLMANFDLLGICVSSGSACSAGSIEPSHVIKALGASENASKALVRISFGRENTQDEFDYLIETIPKVIEMSRE